MKYIYSFSNGTRCISKALIIAFWCSGIAFGMTAAHCADSVLPVLLAKAQSNQFSVSSISIQLMVSFTISFIAVFLSKPGLFFFAAFIKAFCFAYCIMAFVSVSMQGRCIVYYLSSALLLGYWLQNIPCIADRAYGDLCACAVLTILMYIFGQPI